MVQTMGVVGGGVISVAYIWGTEQRVKVCMCTRARVSGDEQLKGKGVLLLHDGRPPPTPLFLSLKLEGEKGG